MVLAFFFVDLLVNRKTGPESTQAPFPNSTPAKIFAYLHSVLYLFCPGQCESGIRLHDPQGECQKIAHNCTVHVWYSIQPSTPIGLEICSGIERNQCCIFCAMIMQYISNVQIRHCIAALL